MVDLDRMDPHKRQTIVYKICFFQTILILRPTKVKVVYYWELNTPFDAFNMLGPLQNLCTLVKAPENICEPKMKHVTDSWCRLQANKKPKKVCFLVELVSVGQRFGCFSRLEYWLRLGFLGVGRGQQD